MCQCDFYSFTLWNSRNWNLYVVRDITDMLCFKTIPWRHNKYCKFGSCKSCVDNFHAIMFLLVVLPKRINAAKKHNISRCTFTKTCSEPYNKLQGLRCFLCHHFHNVCEWKH